jgi:hypothetical protein
MARRLQPARPTARTWGRNDERSTLADLFSPNLLAPHWFALALVSLAVFFPQFAGAAEDVLAEDFEDGFKADRWTFSEGGEFPGASGRFEKTNAAAHSGHGGGRLSFDFTGGGNYVAAILKLDQSPDLAAVKLWMFNPGHNRLTFRYGDQTGQVHQKPFTAPKGRWSEVVISLDDWQGHWGGANDGKVHGPPQWIGFLVENTDLKKGVLDLDDIRLVPGKPTPTQTVQYTAFRFAPAERWGLRPGGDHGESKLDGGKLAFDFTRGVRYLALDPLDQSFLGRPVELRLHLRGEAPGHPLVLHLATHFMVFERLLGEISGPGEHEIVVPFPPGKEWRWFGGENDGGLHGPLRLASLVLNAENRKDRGSVELLDIQVKTEFPADRACLLLAEYQPKDNTFVATARSLLPNPVDHAKLVWALRDWDGATVGQGVKDLRLPAQAEPCRIAVDVPAGTREFVEAQFELQVEGQKIAPAAACYVAPVAGTEDGKPDPTSPWGMGLYLYRYPNTPQGLAEMDRAAELAARAGVKWSREEFNWARIEGRKGEYDWSFYDRLVATAKRHGIGVYGLLAYWSDWTKPYTQEGIDDYCRFAAAAAERYRGDIQSWEIWNEPNIFFWQGPKDLYATLLKQAHDAIKKANAKAQVLGCSTAGVDVAFIKRTLELHGPFDVLTIHPYRAELIDPGFIDDLQKAADLVKPATGPARPVWITEMGWTTSAVFPWAGQDFRPVGERQQAQLLARSYLDALASGVDPNISWYDFRDDGEDPFNFECHMGIVTRDFHPKPAYRAFATLTRLLGGKHFDGPVEAGRGVVAFRFTGEPGTTVVALWSPDGELNATLPATGAGRLVNLMGASRKLEVRDGKVTVRAAAGQPVFVVTGEP